MPHGQHLRKRLVLLRLQHGWMEQSEPAPGLLPHARLRQSQGLGCCGRHGSLGERNSPFHSEERRPPPDCANTVSKLRRGATAAPSAPVRFRHPAEFSELRHTEVANYIEGMSSPGGFHAQIPLLFIDREYETHRDGIVQANRRTCPGR